jgi:hypothetical protein
MNKPKKRTFFGYLAALGLVFGCGAGFAADGGLQFSGSGFLTLAAGRVFGGDPPQDFNGYRAPIFVTDYAQGSVYQHGGWALKPDSKLGLQGELSSGSQWSLTGQIVARGALNGNVDLEWIYGSYQLSEKLTLQIGRKRLPLFYYSETQDVGFSFPWTHLASQFYGWEIVNYNGMNLLYHDRWGDWAASVDMFGGDERRNDLGYWKIYNGRNTRTDSRWSDIVGADLTLSRGWFETRLAYIQSYVQDRFEDPTAPPPYDFSPRAKQRIWAAAFNVDYEQWLLRTEFQYLDRSSLGDENWSQVIGIGYRIGRYTPMLTYSNYREQITPSQADPALVDPATLDPLSHEGHQVMGLVTRYDLTPSSDVKLAVEWWKDKGGVNFNGGVPYGSPRLLSLTYDRVF